MSKDDHHDKKILMNWNKKEKIWDKLTPEDIKENFALLLHWQRLYKMLK